MRYEDIDIELNVHREVDPSELTSERLTFGMRFSPHMFRLRYEDGAWREPRLCPYAPLVLDPAALVLHYAQESFEGLKAFASADGEVLLFRPTANSSRLNVSNRRLCIPELPGETFLLAIEGLVDLDRAWVPSGLGTALYLRPVVIATEAALGVRVSRRFLFYVIASPVGRYFESLTPVRVRTSTHHVRAAPGGTGAAKTAGNYAASLLPGLLAREAGYHQVLYLDAREGRYVEELGGMNVFAVVDGRLVTPPLTGTILAGITRETLLVLAADLGIEAIEEPIEVDDLVDGIESGRVSELFASGTAAVVTAIGVLGHRGVDHQVGDGEVGPLTRLLHDRLVALQHGRVEDPYGWTQIVPRRHRAPV